MLSNQIIARIRKLQLRARRVVSSRLGGRYQSAFRGPGIVFEEVRAYSPGDDVRSIDWNVTARMGQPFVKRYVEERERNVYLVVDVSSSMNFGTDKYSKSEVAGELASVLAFAALGTDDKVGLLTFSDQVERFVYPRRSPRQGMKLIRDVLFTQERNTGTSIGTALDYLNKIQRRRSLAIVLSDFHDTDFEDRLKRIARRHDIVAIRVIDKRERSIPNLGRISIIDAESGARRQINTSDENLRSAYEQNAQRISDQLAQQFRSARVDWFETDTSGNHLDHLVRFLDSRG